MNINRYLQGCKRLFSYLGDTRNKSASSNKSKTTLQHKKKARIAIVGTRGIPAKYGGYETITQILGIGLTKKGYEVYVTCESKGFKIHPYSTFQGVNLVYFPIINSARNISDVMLYDALSVLWATFSVDIIYMLSYTNSPLLILPRIFRKNILVNADGLEWKRRKHNKILRFLLRSFESISLSLANSMVVDSKALGLYYQQTYKVTPSYVPYGVKEIKPLNSSALLKFNLKPNEYYLLIARLEPENNIDLIIDEFIKSSSKRKLIIIAPLVNKDYVKKLLEKESEQIVFLGGIYEPRLQRTFRHNCFAYIHGHEVGGTNPTLVEALSCHNIVLALNVSFNKEVAGDGAFYFNKNPGNLSTLISSLERKKACQFIEIRKQAYERYLAKYSVGGMVDASEELFKRILSKKGQI